MTTIQLRVIRVFRSSADARRGVVAAGALRTPCALGRSGLVARKREGDGGTPRGRFGCLRAFYRPDRIRRPPTRLPVRAIAPADGWCDDPRDRRYNRPVRLPCAAGHEAMRRADGLYDLVIDLAYNRGPIRRGRGSAIFLHCAAPGFTPTQGCVAVPRPFLFRLLGRIGPHTRIVIGC